MTTARLGDMDEAYEQKRMPETEEPNSDSRIDRLPETFWRWKIFLMSGLAVLFAWSNYVSGLVLAQLTAIGWVDATSSALFTSVYMAGMFFG